MLKKYLFIIFCGVASNLATAQQQPDTLAQIQDSVVRIVAPKVTPLDSLQRLYDAQVRENKRICAVRDSLVKINLDMQSQLDANAYTFLFAPYDEYNVEQLAKHNYHYITDPKLLKNAAVPRELLAEYKQDIKDVAQFIAPIPDNLGRNPMNIDKKSAELLAQFNALPAVARYKKLSHWDGTYLGKYIAKIQTILRTLNLDNTTKGLSELRQIHKTLTQ